MRTKRILLVAAIMVLAGCGRQEDLRPRPGQAMPVRPAMARSTPTFQQLLTPPIQARPTRIDELVTRSKPRPDDPFDLPPPTGGAAPSSPPAADIPANQPDSSTDSNPGD